MRIKIHSSYLCLDTKVPIPLRRDKTYMKHLNQPAVKESIGLAGM
ncbi:MAG: hypothetical protein ACHQK8_09805 [Bacteroidia bacterium]